MPETQQSQFIAFRASGRLLGALQERARIADISVSELLRSIVRGTLIH